MNYFSRFVTVGLFCVSWSAIARTEMHSVERRFQEGTHYVNVSPGQIEQVDIYWHDRLGDETEAKGALYVDGRFYGEQDIKKDGNVSTYFINARSRGALSIEIKEDAAYVYFVRVHYQEIVRPNPGDDDFDDDDFDDDFGDDDFGDDFGDNSNDPRTTALAGRLSIKASDAADLASQRGRGLPQVRELVFELNTLSRQAENLENALRNGRSGQAILLNINRSFDDVEDITRRLRGQTFNINREVTQIGNMINRLNRLIGLRR